MVKCMGFSTPYPVLHSKNQKSKFIHMNDESYEEGQRHHDKSDCMVSTSLMANGTMLDMPSQRHKATIQNAPQTAQGTFPRKGCGSLEFENNPKMVNKVSICGL